jgi:glycogen operon protein
MPYPPVIWHIELSEVLADTKVIAEAWDAAGLYQIGYFPGYRWAEWNGRYRDDVRRFVKGDAGMVGAMASRIAGSSDIYQARDHLPINSVNFITCHDGFTLNDLVSYDHKHNDANGEGNRDGMDDNASWNCGVEGPSADEAVENLRQRQLKNFAVILLLSRGVPMILGGDEVRRTQHGNNNAYCQDSEISWMDWAQLEEHAGILRFFTLMIAFRKQHPVLRQPRFFDGAKNERGLEDVAWHGCRLFEPGFEDPNSKVLAFTLAGMDGEADLHVMLNMDRIELGFELPALAGRRWFRSIDTALPAGEDIIEAGGESEISGHSYLVQSHSAVVLISR